MIRSWFVSLLLAVALAACGRGGAAAALDAPIQLAPGEAAYFADAELQVKFVGIDSDSRCPGDVACVWAGEVVVRLTVRKDGRTQELGVREAQSMPIDGFKVAVLQVLPVRASSQPIAPADYRVTLKLTR
ncbi:MAG TPA: hypothetical protein VH814_00350 [Steroidobacteraceae bacterium]|jgi:hypothetical protein